MLDLLRANYTFVNERLAKHYGIPDIHGSEFRRVTFPAKSGAVCRARKCSGSDIVCHANFARACGANGCWKIFSTRRFLRHLPEFPLCGKS